MSDWRAAVWRRLLFVANAALRFRWLLVGAPAVAAIVMLAVAWRTPLSYTATARFMPQVVARSATATGVTALALTGGSVASDPTQVPDFYIELLHSRPVLERTAQATYDAPAPGHMNGRYSLVDLYGDLDRAAQALSGSIATNIAPRTGIITVSVTQSTPQLAQQIAARLLDEVDAFNRQRRQSRVTAERKFTEARLASADSDLRESESALLAFYERNRGFDRSPELRFDEQRLQRSVTQRQAIYTSLAQAYEQAKIDEVRDTPVITIFEDPRVPKNANPRNRVVRALNAAGVALLVAVGFAFLIVLFRGSRPEQMDELEEFHRLRAAALGDIRHPGRAVGRLWS